MLETPTPTLLDSLRAELVVRRQALLDAPMTEREREHLRDQISWLEQQLERYPRKEQNNG